MSPTKKALVIVASSIKETQIEIDIKVGITCIEMLRCVVDRENCETGSLRFQISEI